MAQVDPQKDPIVIVGAARTPMGGFQGELASESASNLGGVAIRAALNHSGLRPAQVDEIIMGNVLGAGQGQAPARQAAFAAGLPKEVPASTLNKMCGSGMKTTMIAVDQLLAGFHDVSTVNPEPFARRNQVFDFQARVALHENSSLSAFLLSQDFDNPLDLRQHGRILRLASFENFRNPR